MSLKQKLLNVGDIDKILCFLFLRECWSRFLFLYSGTFESQDAPTRKWWSVVLPPHDQLKHTKPWRIDRTDPSVHFLPCVLFLLPVSLSEKFTVHIQAWIKPLCWRLWSWGSGATGPEAVGRSENSCWSGSWAVMCSAALGKRVCFTNWRIKTSKNQVIYSHLFTKSPPEAHWVVLFLTQNMSWCRHTASMCINVPSDASDWRFWGTTVLLWFCCSRCCRSIIEVMLRVLQNLANDQCPTYELLQLLTKR